MSRRPESAAEIGGAGGPAAVTGGAGGGGGGAVIAAGVSDGVEDRATGGSGAWLEPTAEVAVEAAGGAEVSSETPQHGIEPGSEQHSLAKAPDA